MTLEDLFILINETKNDVFNVVIKKQGITLIEVNYKVIEKYWEYFTDEFLLKKIDWEPIYGLRLRTIVGLLEEKK